MNDLTHVDLFTGLAGFSLAARANGICTVAMCECDPHCRAFLAKAWPGVPVHEDIKTFPGELYRGAFLLTAGVPCQPASRAGKQRGAGDDRWLWPAALAALESVKPAWALFENPPGIEDVGLDGILAQVEGAGYEVGPIFDIPACAVGSSQLRERYWIVVRANQGHAVRNQGANGAHPNFTEWSPPQEKPNRCFGFTELVSRGCAERLSSYLEARRCLHGVHGKLLGALGNSIVWPLAAEIIAAIKTAETRRGDR